MSVGYFIGFIYICSLVSTTTSNSDEGPDAYYPAPEWSDTFDWKLLKAFSAQRNVMVSPFGLKLVLALLYEGSSGQTEREFQNVLQFPINKTEMRRNFVNILGSLQPSKRDEYILNLGTGIFLDSRLTPKPKFATIAAQSYNADVKSTNYSQPLEASRTINSWIEKLTTGRVTHLVSQGDMEEAIMILANAIYFKGTWRYQFPKNQTTTSGFYVSLSNVVNVPYMTTIEAFYYFESNELDAKILRLPYKGQKFSLFIVLPNSKAGLSDLIKRVHLQVLKKQLYLMDKVPVHVCLPKFQFKFQGKFTQPLKDFGLKQMFQNTASFTGIADGIPNILRQLVVSNVVQKTGIEIDEEGSTAFAATEVQIGNKFGDVDYVFNATHPFMFFLEEETTGTILFVGKVENPLESKAVLLPPRLGENQDVNTQQPIDLPSLQPQNPERDAVIRRFNYFDLELLKEFSEFKGNVFLSPASIKSTLALILEGAKGNSAVEIGNALRIGDVQQREIREILDRLLFDLNDSASGTRLTSANAVFVSDKRQVVQSYDRKVKKYYRASINKVDFSNTNSAVKTINSWAYNATSGFINNIVGSGLPPDTVLLLANALYFKGKWRTEFNLNNTREKCFHSPTRSCVNIPMMELSQTFNYNFNIYLNAHVLEIPYQDDKYAMLILLPTNGNNVKTLARDMQHAQINMVIDSLKPTELSLELPRFEIDYEIDLAEFLRPLKIQEIFGPRANLTGMVQGDNVRISNILHKTKIEVNEQGTRAAAVTSAVVVPLMGSGAQKIIADQPFLFLIYHKESRNIIFEGLFTEPQAEPVAQTVHYTNRYDLLRSNIRYQ